MAPTLTCAANLQRAMAGPYPVYNCNGHTPTISVLIETLQTTLQSVLNDLSQYRATAAYTTFFKHVSFASDVHDIYSNIMLGTPVAPGPHAIKYPPPGAFGVPRTPQFICVTAREQVTWSLEQGGLGGRQFDAYTACENSPIQAFGIFGTKYLQNTIVLCPAFWKWLAIPSSSQSACLTVDPHFNRFRSDGKRLVNYQLWVLLHELAHVYIYAKSGSLSDVFSPNDCALLSGSSAVNNAQNYVYYAANIRLGCTNFPRPQRTGYDGSSPINTSGVELLEIDTNTTLTGGARSHNTSVYEGGSAGNDSIRTIVDIPNTAP